MSLSAKKIMLATLPILTYGAKTFLQKKHFDNYQICLHLAITAGVIYSANDNKTSTEKVKDLALEIFKFSIISSIAILTKDQAPIVKIGAKVTTELCTRFSAEYIKGTDKTFFELGRENIVGVAAHHTLNEYRVFESMFGEHAWLLKPATRSVDYSLNKSINGFKEFKWAEFINSYLGNAAYLNTAAPKLFSENVVEKSMAISLTAVLKAFTQDVSNDISRFFS